jgi:hypothetical protein
MRSVSRELTEDRGLRTCSQIFSPPRSRCFSPPPSSFSRSPVSSRRGIGPTAKIFSPDVQMLEPTPIVLRRSPVSSRLRELVHRLERALSAHPPRFSEENFERGVLKNRSSRKHTNRLWNYGHAPFHRLLLSVVIGLGTAEAADLGASGGSGSIRWYEKYSVGRGSDDSRDCHHIRVTGSGRERSFSRSTIHFVGGVWKGTRQGPAVLSSSCEQNSAQVPSGRG